MVGVGALVPEQATARALAPYSRVPLQTGDAPTGGLRDLLERSSQRLATGEPGAATEAAVAQISNLARQFLQGFQASGATAGSFDLRLDLQQFGMRVDGRGGRSAEGRSLSVDLHVEAERGVIQTKDGPVAFERFEISFTIEEVHARLTESPAEAGAVDAASGEPRTHAGPARPGRALLDGLQQLASLLDRATRELGDQQEFGLDQLRELLAGHAEELDRLLEQIGRAMETIGRRAEGQSPGTRSTLEARLETTEVRLEAIRFVRAAPDAAADAGATVPAEAAAA